MGKPSEVKKRQIKREDRNRNGKRQQVRKKTFRGFLGLLLVTDFCTCSSQVFWKNIALYS